MQRSRWSTFLFKRTRRSNPRKISVYLLRILYSDCWQITANFNIVDLCPGIVNTRNGDRSVSRILLTRKLTTSPETILLWQCVTPLSKTWLNNILVFYSWFHSLNSYRNDDLMTNVSWRGWPQFSTQLLQIPQKQPVRDKSYPWDGFCICRTLPCNISWIVSC